MVGLESSHPFPDEYDEEAVERCSRRPLHTRKWTAKEKSLSTFILALALIFIFAVNGDSAYKVTGFTVLGFSCIALIVFTTKFNEYRIKKGSFAAREKMSSLFRELLEGMEPDGVIAFCEARGISHTEYARERRLLYGICRQEHNGHPFEYLVKMNFNENDRFRSFILRRFTFEDGVTFYKD